MVRLKPGDRVDCRIKEGNIVGAYHNYDEIKTFEIVACDGEGYYIYAPHYFYFQGGSIMNASRCHRLNIDSRFIGERILYISDNQVCHVAFQIDGMKCNKCNDFFVMAQANQPDGKFLCFSCKWNKYR